MVLIKSLSPINSSLFMVLLVCCFGLKIIVMQTQQKPLYPNYTKKLKKLVIRKKTKKGNGGKNETEV